MCRELKDTIYKELKENIRRATYQAENINKEINLIKRKV